MTPRQLKYFVEIARCGSITTAAGTLHIAQPALSHHIAAMEEELGVTLLERLPRGVRLTAHGQRLLERAASILRQMDRLGDEVRDVVSQPRGTVRLCIAGSVAPLLATPLLRAVARQLPEVRLELSTGMSREAGALLDARRVELALLPHAHEFARLQAMPLFEEDFCLFGHPDLLAPGGPLSWDAIAALPLVAPDRDHDLRRLIERIAMARHVTLDVRWELNNPELLRRLVQDGLACAILPRKVFPAGDVAQLVERDIADAGLARTQSLAWRDDQAMTPAAEAVRGLLVDLVADLLAAGALRARPGPATARTGT